VIMMLVGNKTDLADRRQVSIEEGEAKAKEYDIMFIETSAKAGFNIKALFRKVASALPGVDEAGIDKNTSNPTQVVIDPPAAPAEGGGGCQC